MINLPQNDGITCLFDYKNCTTSTWENEIPNQPNFEVVGATLHDDYVEFVGSDDSHAKLTYGGVSGGIATNSSQCIRYVVLKNLSGAYANWKTIIGNEAGTNYCSTIAMDRYGQYQFTRGDIYTSISVADWHVVCWTSDSSTGYSTLWIDGVKINTASGCSGWAADTYLCKGSTWSYSDNNTAFKCFVLGDVIHSDADIVTNSKYLMARYADNPVWRMSVDNEIYNQEFIPIPDSPMTRPYPDALWRIDSNINENTPYNKLMPERVALGAFANATQLINVVIPKSCKRIGHEAFRNTQLTSVTIARDCVYYDTSFPDGCVINFYDD